MLRNFMKWFLYITTGILIVCGISYGLAGEEMVPGNIFGKILLSGCMTALATTLLVPKEEDGKGTTWVKFILHYISLCIIMSFLGAWFDWIPFGLQGIVVMAINVGIVYVLTFVTHYIIDIRQAGEINKMLQEKYGDEEL